MTPEDLKAFVERINKTPLPIDCRVPIITFNVDPQKPQDLLICFSDEERNLTQWASVPLEIAMFGIMSLKFELDSLMDERDNSTIN